MNARQYYYRNKLCKAVGLSYQKSSGIKVNSLRYIKRSTKIMKHVPRLSNDKLLEEILEDLIGNHIPKDFQERLKYLFVAKINNRLFEAKAISNPGMYRGDLIYYYVGLGDGFYEFIIFFTKLYNTHIEDDAIIHDCFRLSSMMKDWRESYPKRIEIFLKPNDPEEALYMEKAAQIAVLIDKFVICHEIAHHLLGHTGKNNDALFFIDNLPEELKSWLQNSLEHGKELQADALAVLFMLKMTENNMKQSCLDRSQNAFNAVMSCLFTLKVLAFLSNDPNEVSKEYPSLNQRLESCKAILSYYIDPKLIAMVNGNLQRMFDIISRIEQLPILKENGASNEEIQRACNLIYLLLVSCRNKI